jgi:hypothetical protein
LSDGRPCALGRHKRRLRRRDPESPMGIHARGRASHECDMDGDGMYLYCFALRVGDTVIQVNKECGKKLMGMSGEEFNKEHGSSNDISNIFYQVQGEIWTISYVIDDLFHCKAVNVIKKPQLEKKHVGTASSMKEVGPSEDCSLELLISLKSFRIKEA